MDFKGAVLITVAATNYMLGIKIHISNKDQDCVNKFQNI